MRYILSAVVLSGVILSSALAMSDDDYRTLAESSVSGLNASELQALCRNPDVTKAAYYIFGVLDEAATRETAPLSVCPGKRSLIDVRNLICGEVGGNLDEDRKHIPAAMVVSGIAGVSMRCEEAKN